MSGLEIAGVVTGAASVLLLARRRVLGWPVGLVNSAAWLVLFWQSRLYLDAVLQVVYLAAGAVGWLWWSRRGSDGAELPVTRTPRPSSVALAGGACAAIAVLWWAQGAHTDAAQPFWDSATTVVSLVAQYLLVRKHLGNWWLWIAVDLAYIGMYAAEGLYLTAAVQPLFIALCLVGLRDWRRSLEGVPALAPA